MSKLKEYCIGKSLCDDGAFGMIHIVKHYKTQQLYVMKIMSKREINDDDMKDQIETEIHILKELDHPNVVKMVDFFEDKKYLYVVMEYMIKGDMADFIQESKYELFEESEAKKYMRHIASGIAYLHSKGVVHRDIKLENLLVNEYDEIKIADFGWAAKPNEKPTPEQLRRRKRHNQEDEMSVVCGTTDYLSREMLKEEPYNEKVDVWAMGIVMYELLTGDVPYNKRFRKKKRLYERHMLNIKIKYPDYLSKDAVDLLSGMLQRDPTQRISAKNVLKHRWLVLSKEEKFSNNFDKNKSDNPNNRRFSV